MPKCKYRDMKRSLLSGWSIPRELLGFMGNFSSLSLSVYFSKEKKKKKGSIVFSQQL